MTPTKRDADDTQAPLFGLVLAGGRGTRLRRDKGALDYHGIPQVRWALQLLDGLCQRSFVSIRAEQAETELYRDLPFIVDRGDSAGPASGLRAALQQFPRSAWLVIAVDMPAVHRGLLAELVGERQADMLATAYRHQDGTPEPLCTIWEPAALAVIDAVGASGAVSLRRLLENGPAKLIATADEDALANVNTPADDARIRQRPPA
jgi:molybdopterin-guanine dinucleotide biosynthesis protein A